MSKKILCVDMDAFFASLEQASNPVLKGKPIAVIGAKERTVVVTCSYEARKLGVRTAMSKYEAIRICPNLILVTGNNKKYTFVSKIISNYFKTITDKVEIYSIDEAFIDITDINIPIQDLAYVIKSFVKLNFGITCSIGVGNNKLIAKMASGFKKPDGFYIVKPENNIRFIDKFKLIDLWGIGGKTVKKLKNMGIYTPRDIRVIGKDYLVKQFGKYGEKIYQIAYGNDISDVNNKEQEVKSIGHSMTLPENFTDLKICKSYLLQLAEMVAERARKHKLAGKTISLYVRYADLSKFSKRKTISYYTSSHLDIYEASKYLFDKNVVLEKGIRLLGVSLNNLVHNYCGLQNLEHITHGWENIYNAMDNINEKYGNMSVLFGSVLNCKRQGSMTISPAWRPNGIKFIDVK